MKVVKEAAEKIHAKISDGLGVLIIDNPKYNILSFAVMNELKEKFDWLSRESEVKAIVFTAKPGSHFFSTGANAREIGELSLSNNRRRGEEALSELHRFFLAVENCKKPTMAVVEGLCLGGGFELALACQYRVVSEHARFGLPEVELGIIPGLGGTQRLPRVLGSYEALKVILRGNDSFISGRHAHTTLRLADFIFTGNVVEAVRDFTKRVVNGLYVSPKRPEHKKLDMADFQNWNELNKIGKGKSKAAVDAAVKSVNEGASLSMEDALKLEQKIFLDLLFSKETRKAFRKAAIQKVLQKVRRGFGNVFRKFCRKKKK